MNLIFIKDNKIVLNGFNNLKDEVYVIERLGGVQFTSTKPDTLCPFYKYPLLDDGYGKIIDNSELVEKLKNRGLGNGEDFMYFEGRYTCINLK